ncbi:MAG: selenocysteine-specific translation elongation factor [Promethearchaeota archaeon]
MSEIPSNIDFIPIHIGLMGHIDTGKTAVSRALSQIISTAGLDKHSQSQQRGITIDLGFTFFSLDRYMITLVDAPGHADLIRSVISAASIIDIAFLVIDVTKGSEIQTGEHLVILNLLKIPKIVVILNKIDLVTPKELESQIRNIPKLFVNTIHQDNVEIFPVSAKKKSGFLELKEFLSKYLVNHEINRNIDGPFKFLFDHHFFIKGKGTILTGTVLSGKRNVGDEITIFPLNQKFKIKSIQKWKQSVDQIQAGDRCGIAIGGLSPESVSRGSFATTDASRFVKGKILLTNIEISEYFNKSCEFGQQVTIIHQMRSLNAKIYPIEFKHNNGTSLKVPRKISTGKKEFQAILWLEEDEHFLVDDIFLLMRLDLSPKQLRIMGIGTMHEILNSPVELQKAKFKTGKVTKSKYSQKSVIVSGLSQSKTGALAMMKYKPNYPYLKIVSPFGNKGLLEIEYDPSYFESEKSSKGPEIDSEVTLTIYKPFKLNPQHSYQI